jgi:hypothetical protein
LKRGGEDVAGVVAERSPERGGEDVLRVYRYVDRNSSQDKYVIFS